MRRRDFIKGIAISAAGWPLLAGAQQLQSARRIGILMGYAEDDLEAQHRFAAFQDRLEQAGWTVGRNLQIDLRWGSGDIERIKQLAGEIVALKPDVIIGNTTPVSVALKGATASIPIVFVIVSDPVGEGLVTSLARPGGNVTGFINVEASMGGKWLELLKEMAPTVNHASIMFNPDTAPGGGKYFLPSFELAGTKLGVTTRTAPVRNVAEIEQAISNLAGEPGGGLVMMTDGFLTVHRAEAMRLAATYKVPSTYPVAAYAREGGLFAYSADYFDLIFRSASYVDRILKGEKPGELPVQVPTKFELVINLKTAKALGLNISQILLATADEVIE